MAEYDDGAYYAVQLNNKLLVFFFMATLAIAVVVFLCGAMIGRGVMVGRGVRNATLAVPVTDIAAGTLRQIPDSRPTVSAGTPKLDYAQRLEEEKPQAKLKPVRWTSPETTVNQTFSPPTPPRRKPLPGMSRRRPLRHREGPSSSASTAAPSAFRWWRSGRRRRLGPFSRG